MKYTTKKLVKPIKKRPREPKVNRPHKFGRLTIPRDVRIVTFPERDYDA